MSLKTKHFFPFIKLVKALNIKEDIKEMYEKTKDKTEEELKELDKSEGLDFIFMFVEKLPSAESEIMNFLEVYTGKSKKEIDEMEIEEMTNIIKEVLTDEKIKYFFQQAMKSMS